MLDGKKILKIGDFGISKMDLNGMKKTLSKTFTGATTPAYVAPEVSRNEGATNKVDIWALGIILYEMVTSRHPFEGENIYAVIEKIKTNDPEPLPLTVSSTIKELISLLLDKDPRTRPDAASLLKSEKVFPYVM